MTHVRNEAVLGGEKDFEALERLVDGAHQLADLILGRAVVGDAAREVVGAVDLVGRAGDGF